MNKVFNFCAGPATLPAKVLEEAQAEFLDYNGSGMSVMELSHRSKMFDEILFDAKKSVYDLLGATDDYEVLFLHGGASIQFAMLPLNFCFKRKTAFIDTGIWSQKALQEASKLSQVIVLASSKDCEYRQIPEFSSIDFSKVDADYLHITSNNTIYGTQYFSFPDTGTLPLIADMSSDIFSKKINVKQFGVIYAGAQKNIGPSGLSLCIIRKDLLERIPFTIPNVWSYRQASLNNSRYHTPNTWAIYLAGKVLRWIKNEGGLDVMASRNQGKAEKLYAAIDASGFYQNKVEKSSRSWMNIPFSTGDEQLDLRFADEAEKQGLMQLVGHRSTKGLRASLYNAMPAEGVDALVDFLYFFEGKFS